MIKNESEMTDEEISENLIRMGYQKKMMRSNIDSRLDYIYYEHPTRKHSFSFYGNGEWIFCSGKNNLVMGLTRSEMEEKITQMK